LRPADTRIRACFYDGNAGTQSVRSPTCLLGLNANPRLAFRAGAVESIVLTDRLERQFSDHAEAVGFCQAVDNGNLADWLRAATK